ncbi:glycoside hydrolase family 88 protein [Stemphylium lycopersici]|nr:glycoside hydrolase family 88 protein [Stemphylium lycopersici]
MVAAVQNVTESSVAAVVKDVDLSAIYSENVAAKIVQVAQRGFKQQAPLQSYPHTVPQNGPNAGRYEEREADFWTCGFFPGCIYALLERSMKYPQALSIPPQIRPSIQEHLLKLGRHYGVAINQMSGRTDTHDMGFIVQPALQRDWELTGNKANLDLLYFAAHTTSDPKLSHMATTHANSIIHEILRKDYSSYHLVNFSPRTGLPQAKMTNQGFADESTWSRGQAWSIMGFAQTYAWTKEVRFLETAVGCASYFLRRCREGESRWDCALVPVWDFDAPVEKDEGGAEVPLRDVSAGIVAANGLLIIHQALQGLPDSVSERVSQGEDYLRIALRIVEQTLILSYDSDLASFAAEHKTNGVHGDAAAAAAVIGEQLLQLKPSAFEGLLRNSTTNWNGDAHKKYKDHGLVYADYYLLEFGNKLLRAGLL